MGEIPKIEVLPENVRFLREEVLKPLTTREIADLMHVSRVTLYNWMKNGIAYNSSNLQNYYSLQQYIEEHGARKVMEGRIVPLNEWPIKIDRRCTIMEPRKEKFSRCIYSRAIGSKFCKMHSEKMRIFGNVYITLNGEIVGIREKRHTLGKLPKRCIAYTYGGYRCLYAGNLKDGLCPNHIHELERKSMLLILSSGLPVTRYAKKNQSTTHA